MFKCQVNFYSNSSVLQINICRMQLVLLYIKFKLSNIARHFSSVVLVLDLGGQVVPDVAEVPDVVLHHQRHVRRHGEGHLGRQAARLGEHVQIPLKRKWFEE